MTDIATKPLPDAEPYRELVKLWVLRLLTGTPVLAKYIQRKSLDEAVSTLLDLPCEIEPKRRNELADKLKEQLDCQSQKYISRESPLFQNIRLLTEILPLSSIEQEVLAFIVLARFEEALTAVVEAYSLKYSDAHLSRLLVTALGCPAQEIAATLNEDSMLMKSGLVRVMPWVHTFAERLEFIVGAPNVLMRPSATVEELISFATRQSAPPTLLLDDYPHLAEDINIIRRYLRQAREIKAVGVNILIYGIPGVGKTELVRVIAQSLEFKLFEVNVTDPYGRSLRPIERFDAYLFNQQILANDNHAIILFDEIEDVLPPPLRANEIIGRNPGNDKGWINRLLEGNRAPAFWIANRVDHIDPAYLRRFDYVLKVENPPLSIRKRILRAALSDLSVPESFIEQHGANDAITPALSTQAARVLRTANIERKEVVRCFQRIVENALAVQGIEKNPYYPFTDDYRLEWLNANAPMDAVCTGLKNQKKGRLLLYGPPGTGKTAFAHFLARQLDQSLTVRRASDIRSMWLGETEKNLAKMFRQTGRDGTILLLDEADSFLQDRRSAVHSWEVTQVNEFLTQMEAFDGIFLCATNFLEHLDSASIRRFGLKIKFDYITFDQRVAMYEGTLKASSGILPSETDLSKARQELRQFTNLTPGDFVTVRGRLELLGKPLDAGNLLEGLKEECQLKPGGSVRKMGFAA